MAHQSEVIMWTQMQSPDNNLRLRVRALIAMRNIAAGRDPNPEQNLDPIMWRIACDPVTLGFLGVDPATMSSPLVDQAAVVAKIATAPDSALLDVINAALAAIGGQ